MVRKNDQLEKKNLARKITESEDEYIFRVCELLRDANYAWTKIASILNEHLGYTYTESKYRKQYSYGVNGARTLNSSSNNDLKIQELNDAREKLRATSIESQRLNRQYNRFELFYENVAKEIKTLDVPSFKWIYKFHECNKEYLLTIADIQAGANFDIGVNKYSLAECGARFNQLACEVVEYVKENNITQLNIVELGDTIQGMLRITDVKLNETSVTRATVQVAHFIANFLNFVSTVCVINYYHVPTSNHSQIRPIGTKANELACEDIAYIIGHYINDLLVNNNRVNVYLNDNIGENDIKLEIFDYNIYATHGHKIKSLKDAIKDLSNKKRELIDFLIIGHFHNGMILPDNADGMYDTEVLVCPSFQGADPYAYNELGKMSKAACKMFVFDKKYGCIDTHKFILN